MEYIINAAPVGHCRVCGDVEQIGQQKGPYGDGFTQRSQRDGEYTILPVLKLYRTIPLYLKYSLGKQKLKLYRTNTHTNTQTQIQGKLG